VQKWKYSPVIYSIESFNQIAFYYEAVTRWSDLNNWLMNGLILDEGYPSKILMYDASIPNGALGRSAIMGYDCTNCSNLIGQCTGVCLNDTTSWGSIIEIDPSNIYIWATNWNQYNYDVTPESVAQKAITHELGHALSLQHPGGSFFPGDGYCTEVQSIMYGDASVANLCSDFVYYPTYPDALTMNQLYPPQSPLPYCGIGYEFCSEGFPCN
jgi:hypothetical protein